MPPAGSFEGKSNELILTPFARLFIPLSVTFFEGNEIPETVIPIAETIS
jgi:hypothetical protein